MILVLVLDNLNQAVHPAMFQEAFLEAPHHQAQVALPLQATPQEVTSHQEIHPFQSVTLLVVAAAVSVAHQLTMVAVAQVALETQFQVELTLQMLKQILMLLRPVLVRPKESTLYQRWCQPGCISQLESWLLH